MPSVCSFWNISNSLFYPVVNLPYGSVLPFSVLNFYALLIFVLLARPNLYKSIFNNQKCLSAESCGFILAVLSQAKAKKKAAEDCKIPCV